MKYSIEKVYSFSSTKFGVGLFLIGIKILVVPTLYECLVSCNVILWPIPALPSLSWLLLAKNCIPLLPMATAAHASRYIPCAPFCSCVDRYNAHTTLAFFHPFTRINNINLITIEGLSYPTTTVCPSQSEYTRVTIYTTYFLERAWINGAAQTDAGSV